MEKPGGETAQWMRIINLNNGIASFQRVMYTRGGKEHMTGSDCPAQKSVYTYYKSNVTGEVRPWRAVL